MWWEGKTSVFSYPVFLWNSDLGFNPFISYIENTKATFTLQDLFILTVHLHNYKWSVSTCNVNASVLRNIPHVHIGAFLMSRQCHQQ